MIFKSKPKEPNAFDVKDELWDWITANIDKEITNGRNHNSTR
jgi:hypothetical protein